MKHPLQEMMDKRRQGIRCGIPSYCSANELVIEIALRRAKERSIPVLIEATANQVNQFGGYTGMKPADFYQMVLKMAKDIDLPENMMILAGDHLGPLTWQKLPEAEAMKNSVELVYQYARAGFTKIHLDTSMKVADDAPGLLKTEVIARRGAQLYKAAMKGYEELKAEKPDAMRPVFVIGSEVPIPGGATEAEDTLAVTSPDAFRDTVSTYQRVWTEEGVGDGMKDVIAVVVQPGVEFGDEQVFDYDPAAAVTRLPATACAWITSRLACHHASAATAMPRHCSSGLWAVVDVNCWPATSRLWNCLSSLSANPGSHCFMPVTASMETSTAAT